MHAMAMSPTTRPFVSLRHALSYRKSQFSSHTLTSAVQQTGDKPDKTWMSAGTVAWHLADPHLQILVVHCHAECQARSNTKVLSLLHIGKMLLNA